MKTNFFKSVVALKSGSHSEAFVDVMTELKRRRDNAHNWLISTETPDGFARYQGAYRALDEIIRDVERAEELARLPLDNRPARPNAA